MRALVCGERERPGTARRCGLCGRGGERPCAQPKGVRARERRAPRTSVLSGPPVNAGRPCVCRPARDSQERDAHQPAPAPAMRCVRHAHSVERPRPLREQFSPHHRWDRYGSGSSYNPKAQLSESRYERSTARRCRCGRLPSPAAISFALWSRSFCFSRCVEIIERSGSEGTSSFIGSAWEV